MVEISMASLDDILKKSETEKGQEIKTLSKERKKEIEDKAVKQFKLGKKEEKILRKRETRALTGKQQLLMLGMIVGLFFLITLFNYSPDHPLLFTVVMLVGGLMFLPIGMFFGWVLIDPFMRCKVLRKVTRRNYGIANFISKGNKMISRIKNFDGDLIWIKNKVWAVTDGGVYEFDKYGDGIIHGGEIDPKSTVTVTDTVPVIFIDIDSMEPLSFQRSGREKIYPEELGATLKGWIDNQMGKAALLRKSLDTYFIILILSAMAAAALSYLCYDELTRMSLELESIKSTVNEILTRV
jgi:hypothetical protein